MGDAFVSLLNRKYLKVRQQYRHLQACAAYLSGRSAPETKFILFGRGRSGTTALVSLLDALPSVRCEGEILHDYVPFPYVHVLGRSAWAASPTYGCKILSYQIRDVQRALDAPTDVLKRLHDDNGFHVLDLRRTNLLRHALSNIRARRERFHQKKDVSGGGRALQVDPENVIEWMRSSESLKEYEHGLLEGVPHLSLTYEEHLRNPATHQSTVDSICEYLDIETAPVETSYQKVAPPSLQDGVANYRALVQRLDGTPYAKYLDE
jgi:LPS sulfotransferase NodH